MDRKKIIIAAAALLLIAAALFFFMRSGSGGSSDSADSLRINTIRLAGDYYKQKEYQRALDLLDSVLINNPDDQEAAALRDKIIAAKNSSQDAEKEKEKQIQDELKESLDELGHSLQDQPQVVISREPERKEEPVKQDLNENLSQKEREKA